MPTSDLAKRRIQNRDNQKKFRQRQIRQLADLNEAFSAQSLHLAEVKRELQRLRLSHRKATSLITNLRRMNTNLESHFTACSSILKSSHNENSEQTQIEHSVCSTPPPSLDQSREPINAVSPTSLEIDSQHAMRRFGSASSILDITDSAVSRTVDTVETNLLDAVSPNNDTDYAHGTRDTAGQLGNADSTFHIGQVQQSHIHSSGAIPSEPLQITDLEPEETSINFNSPSQGEIEHEYAIVDDESRSQNVPLEMYWSGSNGSNALTPDSLSAQSEARFGDSRPQLQDLSLSCDPLFDYHSCFSIDAMQSFCSIPFTSRISKHIVAARCLLMEQPSGIRKSDMDHNAINYAFSWMLRQAWPASANCLKLMGVYQQLFNYELWRNFPCRATYYNIHPLYRPTPIQLAVPHAPAIDWLPWPQLRDKAIEFQSNLDIDLLNMTALKCTVIERTPHNPVVLQQSLEVTTFRAWDVYLLEKNAGISFSDTSLVHTPQSLSVRALLQAYNICVADLTFFRLDKAFFDVFPMLWSAEVASCCKAMPLRYSHLEHLDYPSDLDPHSLNALKTSLQYAYATSGL